jgi:SAM-dependent methyltransferase
MQPLISISESRMPWACPRCRSYLSASERIQIMTCVTCQTSYFKQGLWLNFCDPSDLSNRATEVAYQFYSKFYAPLALLAYLVVWRGNFLKHVAFFRGILSFSTSIVDIATGDGSLTSIALGRSQKYPLTKLTVLDISAEMLEKAYRKLPQHLTTFIRGDVNHLPFANDSIFALTCFGGFNSFPSGKSAMKELARCLSQEGRIRGSVLLWPKSSWRQSLIKKWIQQGFQTESITFEQFQIWVMEANLEMTCYERYGDVLLFELRHCITLTK